MKIFVAGHRGMVGSSIVKCLSSEGHDLITKNKSLLNLSDQESVNSFLKNHSPDVVINAAAKVGGINANNTYPAEFIYNNLIINANLVHSSFINNIPRFINLGSSCIYPKEAPQPLIESSLMTGPLEKTNEAYALAKICGLELCRHYRKQYGVYYHSLMPTNLYGDNDNYNLQNSHVLPALIRKFHEAKNKNLTSVQMWGTGKARREFLHADDVANAVSFLLDKKELPDIINIGTGTDITISDLASKISKTIGFKGGTIYNTGMPDGTMVKRLDMSIMNNLGWKPKISLDEGLKKTYKDFLFRYKNNILRK
ncbi:GDP-L-fucose synthase [bacterium]|nr:GDP-L-fucose synthase [bacterium]